MMLLVLSKISNFLQKIKQNKKTLLFKKINTTLPM